MTLPELQALMARREAEHVEFKPSLLSRKEITEYSVGIGNALPVVKTLGLPKDSGEA